MLPLSCSVCLTYVAFLFHLVWPGPVPRVSLGATVSSLPVQPQEHACCTCHEPCLPRSPRPSFSCRHLRGGPEEKRGMEMAEGMCNEMFSWGWSWETDRLRRCRMPGRLLDGAGKEHSRSPLRGWTALLASPFSSFHFSNRSQALSWEPQGTAGRWSCLPVTSLFGLVCQH